MKFNQIIHGDALMKLRELDDNSIDMCITSPPYPGNKKWGEFWYPENFDQAHDFLGNVWMECLRVLRDGCKMAINIANTKRRPYLPNTAEIYHRLKGKCEPLGEIIWNKGYGQLGTAWGSYCNPSDPSLADQHEYILIFRKYGERNKQPGNRHINPKQFKSWRNSVWNIPPAKASKIGHPFPFPLEIPNRLIVFYTYKNEIVLDPFMGSGQTAIACKELNRQYIGIDHDIKSIELAKKRLMAVPESLFKEE